MKIKMIDAAYLRRQAELCFAIADLMSNSADAKLARLAAEAYEQRAEKADQEQNIPASATGYLRRQAELCFAIADLMSNPADAKLARLAAESYEQRAEKADQEQDIPASATGLFG